MGTNVSSAWDLIVQNKWTVGVGLYVGIRLMGLWRPRGFAKTAYADRLTKAQVAPGTRPGRTGVLLVNLGTPDSLSVPAVRKYLREFLMDERVIDGPPYCRWMLVNLIIAPFRARSSYEKYARIWDHSRAGSNEGSPLVYNSMRLADGLRGALGPDYVVELAMRYQSPSVEQGLMALKRQAVEHLIVLPLFPQYASATTGSVHCKVFECLQKWDRIPTLTVVSSWVSDGVAEAFARNAEKMIKDDYDFYIFSYHGIPEKYIDKGNFGGHCTTTFEVEDCGTGTSCCASLTERNRLCYRAQCYDTTRRIVKKLGIKEDRYQQTFQSRLGPTKWLGPYTDETIVERAKRGDKRVLVFSPAFTADCLETTDEIANECREEFLAAHRQRAARAGTELDPSVTLQLVPSLNGDELFVRTVADVVRSYTRAKDS